MERLQQAGLTWRDVFQELPLQVVTSSLGNLLLKQLEPNSLLKARDYNRLKIVDTKTMDKMVEDSSICVDDVVSQVREVSLYQQNKAKKKPNEPMGDLQEPNQVVSYLVLNQAGVLSDQIKGYAKQALCKHSFVAGLQLGQK
eukprot:TRINITY_DN19917_c0_g1_i1.p4 TRINITY_DN19917_c0_g1~~TRINITY_DN19917_c0_g1_i1.p4  ORF type:complete len:142 (-),score=7.34 TRINITY_DN19917_c0_g1_i1:90-515(-)